MQIIKDRQALHRIPEQGKDLPKTLAYLKGALQGRGFSPCPGALAAFFDFGRSRSLVFRADCDALPMGHCCGHDGHMAILLELSRWLADQKDLPRNILLLFQPAEETTGGAKDICDTGLLEAYGAEAVFGLHIWPGLPKGRLFTKPGPLMARSCQIDGRITAEASHIALPGPDPVAVAAEFVSKTLWESPEGLVKYGLFQGGSAGNVTAAGVQLQGSLRCFQESVFREQQDFLRRTARKLQRLSGCSFALTLSEGYPAVINDAALLERIRQTVPLDLLKHPSFLSEDFSFYQQRVPGVYFFLGAGQGPALHSIDFDFPEEILQVGADLWKRLAAGCWTEPQGRI